MPRKTTTTKAATRRRAGGNPDGALLRANVANARRLEAQIKVLGLLQAKQQLKAALSMHAAADRGRKNADWKSPGGSADLAIIPDSDTMNARARGLERDSWVAKSIKNAFVRNVVGGAGIIITPHAKDEDGKPLTELNQKAQREFTRWARSKLCDVERKKTWVQMQRLAAGEEVIVGEHFWMWSYRPPEDPVSEPCGLQIQSLEPEQLDPTIVSYGNNEVRGGVEVDANGAPVAYHIYTRNPADVLYRHAFYSVRVEAVRIFHYYRKDRVLQTRGSTRLSGVMSEIRDLDRMRNAVLWRTILESCIGVIIKQPTPGGGVGPSPFFPPAPGTATKTSSGMTMEDFVPGMVARLVAGEELESFTPQSPGNQYDPFTTLTVRGIGAGVGMSFGQVMRQADGNYSSARQDMLEDYKEWGTEHDLIKSDLLRPLYQLWFDFAAHEGRFDGCKGFNLGAYLDDRDRFTEAEYVPPPQTWIDPEKEANAFAVLLKNRLITREEIIALRGERIWNVVNKIAAEGEEYEKAGISLPEEGEERAALRDIIKTMVGSKSGTVDSLVTNATDIDGLLARSGIPPRKGYTPPLLPIGGPPGQTVTGEERQNSEGDVIGGKATPPPPPPARVGGPQGGPNGNGKANGAPAPAKAPTARLGAFVDRLRVMQLTAPPGTPRYRAAESPAQSCATCSYSAGGGCTKYAFTYDPDYVCDTWLARTLTENIHVPAAGPTLPPGAPIGQPPLDQRFYPEQDAGYIAGTAAGAVQPPQTININLPPITLHAPALPQPVIHVEAPEVHVAAPEVHVAPAAAPVVHVNVPKEPPRTVLKTPVRDAEGNIQHVIEQEMPKE